MVLARFRVGIINISRGDKFFFHFFENLFERPARAICLCLVRSSWLLADFGPSPSERFDQAFGGISQWSGLASEHFRSSKGDFDRPLSTAARFCLRPWQPPPPFLWPRRYSVASPTSKTVRIC